MLRLGHWVGTSPEFWLNLQKLYELRLAREEIGNRVAKLPRLRRNIGQLTTSDRLCCTLTAISDACPEWLRNPSRR
jgi:hypothetical protein